MFHQTGTAPASRNKWFFFLLSPHWDAKQKMGLLSAFEMKEIQSSSFLSR